MAKKRIKNLRMLEMHTKPTVEGSHEQQEATPPCTLRNTNLTSLHSCKVKDLNTKV